MAAAIIYIIRLYISIYLTMREVHLLHTYEGSALCMGDLGRAGAEPGRDHAADGDRARIHFSFPYYQNLQSYRDYQPNICCTMAHPSVTCSTNMDGPGNPADMGFINLLEVSMADMYAQQLSCT